jgi:ribulose-5-phosphate 4-epimerase/fuculose-1-phosphate aldolase
VSTTDQEMTNLTELARTVALACRILAAQGCAREITGHVSARIPGTDEMLVRCRHVDDPGVEFTTVDDVCRVHIDGTSADLPKGYKLPGEFAIHSELYRSRPDIGGVAHGHPRSALLCGLLDLEIEPFIGAYDPAAMDIAVQGIAIYPRAVLISTPELGRDMVGVMEGTDICLLRGHGIVTAARDVVGATLRAIKLETIAELVVASHAATGSGPPRLPQEDIDDVHAFVDATGSAASGSRWVWDFYVRLLGTAADVGGRG